MATKMLKLEELEEGEHETPFGRVVVRRAGGGYKIVVYVSEKELGKNTVKQMLRSFTTTALGGGEPV